MNFKKKLLNSSPNNNLEIIPKIHQILSQKAELETIIESKNLEILKFK